MRVTEVGGVQSFFTVKEESPWEATSITPAKAGSCRDAARNESATLAPEQEANVKQKLERDTKEARTERKNAVGFGAFVCSHFPVDCG
jgi:hypothetical protein